MRRQSTGKTQTLGESVKADFIAALSAINTSKCEWDSDLDYQTPPDTPIKADQSVTFPDRHNVLSSEVIEGNLFKMASAQKMVTEDSDSDRGTFKKYTDHLQSLVEGNTEGAPETMDVRAVLSMFKKLEEDFEQKLAGNKPQKSSDAEVDALTAEIKALTIKKKAISSAIQHMWDEFEVVRERVERLEINYNKRCIILTGLKTHNVREDKYIAMQEVEEFLQECIGYRPQVEDIYEIGSARPRAKVVVFQSYREKEVIIKFKSLLKDFRNDDNRPYFINEFYGPFQNEKRRRNRQIFKENETNQDEEDKANMQLKGDKLIVEGNLHANKITPPDPQQLMDLTVSKLDEILALPICKGPEITEEDNRFIGFSFCVSNLEQIQDAYFKMRLCHPKARHIMCAYIIDDQDEKSFNNRGCCDDGEHSASNKILDAMISSGIKNRVIFAVRYYNGKKIGNNRFECIRKAVTECFEQYTHNNVSNIQETLKFPEVEARPSSKQSTSRPKTYPKRYEPLKSPPGERGSWPREAAARRSKYSTTTYRGQGTYRGGHHRATAPKRRRSSSDEQYRPDSRRYRNYQDDRHYDDEYDRDYPPIRDEEWSRSRTGAWSTSQQDVE